MSERASAQATDERYRSRRARRRPVPEVEVQEPFWGPGAWRHLVALLVMLGIIVTAGIALQKTVEQSLSGALASCKPARQLAPHTFVSEPPMCIDTSRMYIADVSTSRGRFSITLDAKHAPRTVNNFVVLASNGFYTGLSFWSVNNWSAIGGDPLDNGRGGPGYFLPDEPSAGRWTSGAVGMARQSNGPINGSQFFVLKDNWPGGGPPHQQTYNRFGTVTSGIDVTGVLTAGDRIISITIRVR